jgi:hypothetical protein
MNNIILEENLNRSDQIIGALGALPLRIIDITESAPNTNLANDTPPTPIAPNNGATIELPDNIDFDTILGQRETIWPRCKNYSRFVRYGRFVEEQIRKENLTIESVKKYRVAYEKGQKTIRDFVKTGDRAEGITDEFMSLFGSSDTESIDALLLTIVQSIQSNIEFKRPVVNFIHPDYEIFPSAIESVKYFFRPRLAELIKEVPQEKMLSLSIKFIGCYRKIYEENNAAHLSDPGLIMRRIVDDIGIDNGWSPLHTYLDICELYRDLATIVGHL